MNMKKVKVTEHARQRFEERVPFLQKSDYVSFATSGRYQGFDWNYIGSKYPELYVFLHTREIRKNIDVRVYKGVVLVFEVNAKKEYTLMTVYLLPDEYINGLADREIPIKIGSKELYKRVDFNSYKEYVFRRATVDDIPKIGRLLDENFGFVSDTDDSDRVDVVIIEENYYVVAEKDDKLVAVTGLVKEDVTKYLGGYEIGWTCTDKDYRGQGIMLNLMRKALIEGRKDDKPVYCSCWRINNEEINLKSVMKELGFTLLYKARTHYKNEYYKICEKCVYNKNEKCECYEDLYILR